MDSCWIGTCSSSSLTVATVLTKESQAVLLTLQAMFYSMTTLLLVLLLLAALAGILNKLGIYMMEHQLRIRNQYPYRKSQ
jgi:hypothetical protein